MIGNSSSQVRVVIILLKLQLDFPNTEAHDYMGRLR